MMPITRVFVATSALMLSATMNPASAAAPQETAQPQSIGAWVRGETGETTDPRAAIVALLEARDWDKAAAACRDWLRRDPAAVWPLATLAGIHERKEFFISASILAARAHARHAAEQGALSPAIGALEQRLHARLVSNATSRQMPEAYAADIGLAIAGEEPAEAGTTPIATPAPQPRATGAVEAAPRVAPSPPAVTTGSGVATPQDEQRYLTDPAGQWAIAATASSEYGKQRSNAARAAGPPDVPSHRDDERAWCPSATSGRREWLELVYAKPVRVTEVRVRQTLNPGTIVKVEGIEPDGTRHVLWEGRDSQTYPPNQIGWFIVRVPPTAYRVERLRLAFDLDLVPGWKQIDAVQLVGTEDR